MTHLSRSRARAAAFAVCLACSAMAPSAGHAQTIRPWTPPSADSLLAWSAEARARFRTNTGDSLGGSNFEAYDLVGRIGRRLLRSLGKANANQAQAIEAVIDSLGLDTDVATDPRNPGFVLLMVHNPFRYDAHSVGWLFWYRQNDLRTQGVRFRGGRSPRTRVWWTASPDAPYEWAVLDRAPGGTGHGFTLLRLSRDGYYWRADQYEGWGPDLTDAFQAEMIDVNDDNRPELLAWARVPFDSLFESCGGCPGLIEERTYTEVNEGFVLHDTRLMPSVAATFTLFVRLLRDHNRTGAARLLADPSKIGEAVAHGWGTGAGRGLWRIENAQSDRPWPEWLGVRFRGPRGVQRWVFHYTQRDGRWVIREWLPIQPAGSGPRRPAADPDSARGAARPQGGQGR